MKRPIVLAIALVTAVLVIWLGVRMTRDETTPHVPELKEGVPALPPPTTTSTDAEEVFKRAFWKRPTENDHILHAERREWADGDGVDRWQWFIAVDPSEELARYLNEQNPFSLGELRGKVAIPAQPRPKWFPSSADSFTARQSQDGQMLFLMESESGRIYATSQGRGFAKAVDAASPTAPVQKSAGNGSRLPNTPPALPEE
jgi:hypothetical protein